jgi:two-component system CitB family sensor kinase
MIHRWSIARRLFVAHLLFMLALTAIVGTASFVDARDHAYEEAGRRMAGIATAVADNPLVLQAAGTADPTALLQPYALDVMRDADADFITIMAPDRTRWTHPNDEELGKPYIGSIDAALNGGVFTEITAGTLGPSVRTIAPVKDQSGTVKALVAVGVTVRTVDVAVSGRLPALLVIGLALLAGGSVASWLLGRYLRRVTRGWGPEQLAQLFAYYESVLHSVREGVILIDSRGRVVMYNDQAAELLGLPPHRAAGDPAAGPTRDPAAGPTGDPAGGPTGDPTGDPAAGPSAGRGAAPLLAGLPLAASLKELFESGRGAQDEIHLTDSRILVVNQGPAVGPRSSAGRQRAAVFGTVATIRDRTEIESLGSELETVRTLSDALRAQTHEHANRLHTIVSLLELGRGPEALDFATKDLELSQRLTDDVVSSIEEPVLGALIMGKVAEARERGVELDLNTSNTGGSTAVSGLAVQDLVAILGNLLDNAIDAAAEAPAPKLVELTVANDGGSLEITVEDSGPGIDPAAVEDIFRHGFSTKEAGPFGRGLGLALVRQAVQRLGGTLAISSPAGALFHVTLPTAAAPAAALPAASLPVTTLPAAPRQAAEGQP